METKIDPYFLWRKSQDRVEKMHQALEQAKATERQAYNDYMNTLEGDFSD